MNPTELVIVGRSTSHFTRITRVFAAEGGLEYAYQVVSDLRVTDPANYAGNPALRIPILRTPRGEWFGSLNICRELFRLAPKKPRVVWPEDLDDPLLANAQELVFQGMANEVTVLMSRFFGEPQGPHSAKLRQSLVNTAEWLETNLERLLALLPADSRAELPGAELVLLPAARGIQRAPGTRAIREVDGVLPRIRDATVRQRYVLSPGLRTRRTSATRLDVTVSSRRVLAAAARRDECTMARPDEAPREVTSRCRVRGATR
ncbi:MAG: hypothetical protein QM784_33175 [Polyangiaceae bacterium]